MGTGGQLYSREPSKTGQKWLFLTYFWHFGYSKIAKKHEKCVFSLHIIGICRSTCSFLIKTDGQRFSGTGFSMCLECQHGVLHYSEYENLSSGMFWRRSLLTVGHFNFGGENCNHRKNTKKNTCFLSALFSRLSKRPFLGF